MSSESPCSKVSARAVSRAAIAYLDGLPKGKVSIKTKDVIKILAASLGCDAGKRGSDQYTQFKERWKKALEAYKERQDDPSVWSAFKKKYEKGKPAKAEVVQIAQPPPAAEGELSSLDPTIISKLADMCRANKTRKDIDAQLSKHKITKLGGERISKVKKGDLCDAILSLAPQGTASAAGATTASPCDVKSNTIAHLKEYIASRGWPPAPSKAKKADICQYIAKMESEQRTGATKPSDEAEQEEIIDVPPGYDKCSSPRGPLTKPKIKQWIMDKGWDKEAGFEGFPSERKDKAAWCEFLAKQIASHQVITPPSVQAPQIIERCYDFQDWKTQQDVETSLAACPSGKVCDITKKQCLNTEDAEKLGLERHEIKLKNGKIFPIYSNSEQLKRIQPALQNFVISRSARPTPPKPAPAPVIQPIPVQKSKGKVVFKAGTVKYGDEEKKKQKEAEKMLAGLLGDEKEEIPIAPKEPVIQRIPSPKAVPIVESEIIEPTPIVIEEPSAVGRLIQRLKDIRTQSYVPIQLVRAESDLARATSLCAGIKA